MANETTDLLEIIKRSGQTVRNISKALGIPEQRIYGWMNKGAKPKYEDEAKVREYLLGKATNQNQSKPLSGSDALLSVVCSRVAELIAERSGRSSLVEYEQMKKDAESLVRMNS